jgi:signal transduction histidine kinase
MALYFRAGACQVSAAVVRHLIFLLMVATQLAAAEPVLDTVAKVRALAPEEAARELPVCIEATVICFARQSDTLFVRDDTACTYVGTYTPGRYDAMPLEPGMRVRIEGVTDAGGFFPDIIEHRIEILGKGHLPEPRRISEAELFAPALDSQWVEVPAVVTGVESGGIAFTLAIEVYGRKLIANLPLGEHAAERAAQLIQRPVRLQGTIGTVFNTERQMTGRDFFVPSFDQLIPTDTLAPAVAAPPLRAVNGLLRSDDAEQMPVRVAGIITQVDGNNFHLRDASGSMLICTSGKDTFVAGDQVEAEGFAVIAPYRPLLRARKVMVTGHAAPPQPMTLDFNIEKLPRFHAELVVLDAEFLARHDGSNEVVLQCRTGDRFFEALLPPKGSLPTGPATGDRVRLAGICELTTTHPTARAHWVDGFRLHLPNSGGVVILQHAPWWTLRHSLMVLGVVSVVSLLALAWIWLLRRRVKAQTEIIGNQLKQVAERDERQRIARELHDTVEQELTGLSMELGCISMKISQGIAANLAAGVADLLDQAHQMLEYAQKMLRHCRTEARVSIHNLRCIELEQRGLAGALRELLPEIARKCGANFELLVSGDPQPVDATVENHLLRIAQEGVTNATHHAKPGEITVALDYQPTTITLEIRDNGCGFNPVSPPPEGHFGLQGIHERANKIQAVLTVISTPGTGTTIRVARPIAIPP